MEVIIKFQNCSGCPFCKFDYDLGQHYCGQILEEILVAGGRNYSLSYLSAFPEPADNCPVKSNPKIIHSGQ